MLRQRLRCLPLNRGLLLAGDKDVEAVGKIISAEELLEELQSAVRRDLDWETKQHITATLVNGITVTTTGTGPSKQAVIEVRYEFGEMRQNRTGLGVG